eukprot:gene57007-biopygen49964
MRALPEVFKGFMVSPDGRVAEHGRLKNYPRGRRGQVQSHSRGVVADVEDLPEDPKWGCEWGDGDDFLQTHQQQGKNDKHRKQLTQRITRGSFITVTKAFKSSSQSETRLLVGQCGRVQEIDRGGDALIDFAAHDKLKWVAKLHL